jgi:hypothetical protein
MFFKKKILLLFSLYPYPISGPWLPWPSAGQVLCRSFTPWLSAPLLPLPHQPNSASSPPALPGPAPLSPSFSPLERRGPAAFPTQLTARAPPLPFTDARGPHVSFFLPSPVELATEPKSRSGQSRTRRPCPAPFPRGPARQGASSGYLLRPRSRAALTQNPSSTSAAASALTLAGRHA